jgi:hypothetical protein
MANQVFNYNAFRDLLEGASLIGQLAKDENAFREAYEALRLGEPARFQAVLNRLGLARRCGLICEWIRIKECFFFCLELCGSPAPASTAVPNPRMLAEAVVRLTSDEKLVHALVDAIEKRNRQAFQRIVNQFNLQPLCHLFCHWLCVVRYRLICRWVCSPVPIERPNLVQELLSAGQALRALLQHGDSFDQAVAASNAGDAGKLSSVINGANLFQFCYFICEWFCSWRCALVCLTLCREFPAEPVKNQIDEALAFAKAAQQLGQKPDQAQRLMTAVSAGDAKTWAATLKELQLQPFCIQLCHWICGLLCREFCFLVCPPIFNHPWFTHVGDFGIYSDIDAGTGLTNKSQAGHGGPGYGFFDCLKLRGFCPKFDPANPGSPMAYRFLYQPAGAPAATPITGGFVCEVLVGSRYTFWNGNPFALQSVRIRGTGVTSPTPPPPGPGLTPPDHYIVPDAQGWVSIDANALDDGFNGWLMGFSSPVAFPGGDPAPGVAAGVAVPAANQKNGADSAIIFQATRVSTIAAVNGGAAPDYSNTLGKIHINNWNEVSLINLQEFGGGLACSPVTNDLHIQYTTDHELMADWSIDMVTAAVVAPAPVFPSGSGPRGAAGTDFHDTSTWPSCSYLLRLITRRSLTDGLLDDPDKWEGSFLTFCIEH